MNATLICSVDDCDGRVVARGICNRHYHRLRASGNFKPLPRPTIAERFWAKVEKTDTCWNWTGAKVRGYGCIGLKGRSNLAHRWSYERARGPIPEGRVLDHLCRNRACVNPEHLEVVTQQVNTLRGLAPIVNRNKDTCRNGLHPWPESAAWVGGKSGQIKCLPCRRARAREHQQRKRDEAKK